MTTHAHGPRSTSSNFSRTKTIKNLHIENLLFRAMPGYGTDDEDGNYSPLSPEEKLWICVIARAIVDGGGGNRDGDDVPSARAVRRFFSDGRLELWCSPIGLDPERVMEIAHQYWGYKKAI